MLNSVAPTPESGIAMVEGGPVPEVSRRVVLAASVTGAGVVVLASASTPAVAGVLGQAARLVGLSPSAALEPGALPVRSIYAPAIATGFRAADGRRSVNVRLDAVEDLEGVTSPGDENRFCLLFTAVDGPLTEGTYTLRRAGVATTTLFLAPIGPGGGTQTLQAVVNSPS